MATYKIGDKLDRSKLGTLLVEPSELFALKWGNKWFPSYRSGWSTKSEGTGPVRFTTINEANEDEVYPTAVGLAAFPSMRDVIKSDGPNGPLRITPRLMTAAERAQVNTRKELSGQHWLSASPSCGTDLVAPYYAEIKCDIPVKPDGTYVALWPAFWQLLSDGDWNVGTGGPEFDILEVFGERYGKARITTGFHSSLGKAWSDLLAGLPPIEYVTEGSASNDVHIDPKGVHVFGGWIDSDGCYMFHNDVCMWVWPYSKDLTGRQTYMAANFAIGKGGSSAGDIKPGETSVGTWTIYDIRVNAVPAAGGTPTPVPTPVPAPVPVPPTPTPGLADILAAETVAQTALAAAATEQAKAQTALAKLRTLLAALPS